MPTEEEILTALVREIVWVTNQIGTGECTEEDLPTAADIARKYNYRLEAVKKKLRILKDQGLIHSVSVSPKRYRFDYWALKTVEVDTPLYSLFCEPNSPYYVPH